jgi:hypothetical protein
MDYILDLPPGWLPGLPHNAPAVAHAELEGQGVIGIAQDGDHRGPYIPSLILRTWGPAQVADADKLLDDQAREFEGQDCVRMVARMTLPVGPSLRVVITRGHPVAGRLALVAYFMVTPIGGYELQFFCAEPDLPRYEAAFTAAAESVHIPEKLLPDTPE